MSAIANLVAYDGQSTPVIHTFYPESVSREADGAVKATWKEAAVGVPDYAQGRVTAVGRKLKSGVNRVSVRVELPVMESVSGVNASGYTAAPKVAYVDAFEGTLYGSPRSTIAGRRGVRQLGVNIINGSAGSTVPITSGQIVEMFDLLLNVT